MEKKPSTHDPGWNDPPLFSYEEHTAQLKSTKPRTLLNKRISFPMESSSPPTSNNHLPIDPTLPMQPCDLGSLPPPFIAICPAKIEPKEESTEDISTDDERIMEFNSEEALASVVDNLNSILNSKTSEPKNRNEIGRRLDIMKKMWTDGKFSIDVQRKVLKLSEAVKERNTLIANDYQIGLMVDHPSLCSTWMPGVRYLIQHGADTVEEPIDS